MTHLDEIPAAIKDALALNRVRLNYEREGEVTSPFSIVHREFLPFMCMDALSQLAAPSEGSTKPEQGERAGGLRDRGAGCTKRKG